MLSINGIDLDLRVGLSVTLSALITLFGLHLVNADLLALAVLHNTGGNGSAGNYGSAENAAVVIQNSQNPIEGNGLTGFGVHLLNVDDIALGNRILLAAYNNNSGFHEMHLPLYKSLALGAKACALLACPFKAAFLF